MRRRIALSVLLLLLAAVTIPAIPGAAQTSQPMAAQQPGGVRADFNQDGFADLAVGAPFEDVGSIGTAGTVTVLYGTASGTTSTGSQLFTQVGGAIEAGDGFGGSLAAGDFNHDGFADLAAGASGEAVGGIQGAGAVSILYGSAGGLTASGGRLFTQVGGVPEAEDFFGLSLAAGDFNHDGFTDLAAGARGETALGRTEAGAVSVLDGSSGGLTATGGRLFIQVTPEVQTSGLFGFALATGDVNGDGAADLAVGAAGHNEFAGAVSVLYGSAAGVTTTGGQLFTQDSPGVPGASEPYDYFGASLAAASLGAISTAASPTGTSSTARPAQPSR